MHVEQAVRESWGRDKLAEVAGVSKDVAADVLAQVSARLVAKVEEGLSCQVNEMRVLAARERPAVVRRLKAAGELCDDLLAMARELLGQFPVEQPEDEVVDGVLVKHALLEDRALKVASIVQKAAAAAGQSWAAYKDASGLALAERVKESGLVADAKAKSVQDGKNASAIEVEVIFAE